MSHRVRTALDCAMVAAATAGCHSGTPAPARIPLPLVEVAQLSLPGDSSRFDYESLDPQRGLLFIAHLGASQLIEVDVRARRVTRTIASIAGVHGVLVVPGQGRAYATATGANQLVALDETTGALLGRAPTGAYPDGLTYDSAERTIWTTNEQDGSETVVDARTMRVLTTVRLGGSVGNVAYDPVGHQILVDVQSDNTLVALDPTTFGVTHRLQLPGCDHDHGLALDPPDRLAFVACDGNAALLTVDLTAWTVTGSEGVGNDPDVLSYDPAARRLFVAAESGWVTVLHLDRDTLHVLGRDHLADGAHVVATDPNSGVTYLPIPHGADGRPALLIEKATP